MHQIARDFGLAVHHHALADQITEVDTVTVAVEAQFDAVMNQPLALHARAGAGFVEQVSCPFFDHPGAYAAENILGTALLEDDV